MLLENSLLAKSARIAWKKIGIRNHHGINIPLFSLRTENSCGIGEFFDLLPLFPWCKKIGLDVVQLLPLNDPGPDSSPYSAISAFALNPLHISLTRLPFLDQHPSLSPLLSKMKNLNASQRINYAQVRKEKEFFLHEYFQKVSPNVVQSNEYLNFLKKNPWLEGYSLFKAIKITRQWQTWEDWPLEMRDPTPASYQELAKEFEYQINYHTFVQYLCFSQFNEIKIEAEKHSIFIMGDIPILISRESSDVWLNRNLFLMQYSAGAPPDMYSADGQNWGFPIYDWVEHNRQNYQWWKLRLEVASFLYDIYRLDHVVGFFRIWAIPPNKTGKEGKFIPENSNLWIPQGEKILQMMLTNPHMLPIGEDLGVVPPEVRTSLLNLGICGTKVMRWERKWNQDKSFINIEDYIPESLTTVSTHDSTTLTEWWRQNADEARAYAQSKGWSYADAITKDQLFEILKDSHHSGSLFHINLLNEYLALIPGLTWSDPKDERINIPGVFSDLNWTYRFRPSVEEIVANKELANVILLLINRP